MIWMSTWLWGTKMKALGENTPITIGLAILVIGFAFWMGKMHSDLSNLGEQVQTVLQDHEQRIRALEAGK